ncbi:peptidase E [Candidatus Parcubacteria bacterium]|nr:peptidase E [Candidatus Parcubacteria bacterium]
MKTKAKSDTLKKSHIVPFGGLSRTPNRPHPLINYLLELTGKPRPKVTFIPTAAGDSAEALVGMYSRFPADRSQRSHVALFNRVITDLRAHLLDQDIIWVSGGNTVNMLAVWRAHGVDKLLEEAWAAGIILTGGSAGSLCWFEGGTTDSFNLDQLAPLRDGLSFLPGSHCPHYDSELQRRPLYRSLIAEGFPAGYAADTDVAMHFIGTKLSEVVTANVDKTAYRVELRGNKTVETPLEARLIS